MPLLELLLHLKLVLQALDHFCLSDAMVEEEALDFCGETLSCNSLVKKGLNEVLKLDVLILLDGLNDTWAEVCLLL